MVGIQEEMMIVKMEWWVYSKRHGWYVQHHWIEGEKMKMCVLPGASGLLFIEGGNDN